MAMKSTQAPDWLVGERNPRGAGRPRTDVSTRYELHPVENFMLDYDWAADADFQLLCVGMTWEVEFAKALALNSGHRAKAMRMIFPGISVPMSGKEAAEALRKPAVTALCRHVEAIWSDMEPGEAASVTMEDILAKAKEMVSKTSDPKTFLDMAKFLIEHGKVDTGSTRSADAMERTANQSRIHALLVEREKNKGNPLQMPVSMEIEPFGDDDTAQNA